MFCQTTGQSFLTSRTLSFEPLHRRRHPSHSQDGGAPGRAPVVPAAGAAARRPDSRSPRLFSAAAPGPDAGPCAGPRARAGPKTSRPRPRGRAGGTLFPCREPGPRRGTASTRQRRGRRRTPRTRRPGPARSPPEPPRAATGGSGHTRHPPSAKAGQRSSLRAPGSAVGEGGPGSATSAGQEVGRSLRLPGPTWARGRTRINRLRPTGGVSRRAALDCRASPDRAPGTS